MRIPSFDGSELEMHLAGKRWPNLEGGRQTLHWLLVTIRALTPFGSLSFREQALLDWEVAQLIDWLLAIAQRQAVRPDIDFYEGTLSFELVSTEANFITLRCHLLTSWSRWHLAPDIDRREVERENDSHQQFDLRLTSNQLARAAEELRDEFARLPINRRTR